MKKALVLLMSLFVVGLAACGEDVENKEIGNVNSEGNENTEQNDGNNNQNEENETSSYDEVLLDNEDVTVVLQGITTVSDDIFGDEHQIKLQIENKLDETIEVQAHEVSLDGLMVDDMVFFSETVAGGKKSNAELSIMALDEDLPELNENLEFKLMIFNEGFDTLNDSQVSVDIK